MRINGVSPSNPYSRELRRSDTPDAAGADRKRSRFSNVDVILDLTIDAIQRTGRDDIWQARQPHSPPDTYTEMGLPAYSDPPAVQESTQTAKPYDNLMSDAARSRPSATAVTFDGMLRTPVSERALLTAEG